MAKRRKLATLFVDFVADKTGLKRDMRGAEQEVERSSKKMEGSTKRVSGSLNKMGETIERKIAPLDKFTSAVGKAAGVLGPLGTAAAAAVGAITLLGKAALESTERFRKQRAEARKFADQIQGLSAELRKLREDSEDAINLDLQIGDANRRAEQLADELERMTEGGFPGFVRHAATLVKGFAKGIIGVGSAQEEAADKADKASRKTTELQRAQQIRNQIQVRARKDFLEHIRNLELQNADEEVRIREEAQRKIEKLREFEENATFFVDPEEVQRGIDAIKKDRDARLKALEEKREAERQRQKEQEDAEKQALENEKKRAQEAADAKEKAEKEAEMRLHEQRLDNIRRETEARRKAIQEIEQATASSIDALTGRFNNQAHVFKQIDESLRRIADQGVGEAAF